MPEQHNIATIYMVSHYIRRYKSSRIALDDTKYVEVMFIYWATFHKRFTLTDFSIYRGVGPGITRQSFFFFFWLVNTYQQALNLLLQLIFFDITYTRKGIWNFEVNNLIFINLWERTGPKAFSSYKNIYIQICSIPQNGKMLTLRSSPFKDEKSKLTWLTQIPGKS